MWLFLLGLHSLLVGATYCPSKIPGISSLGDHLNTPAGPLSFISACPLNSDVLENFSNKKRIYLGQEDAFSMVENFLRTNELVNTRAVLLHFSGPTGVGKTLLAHLIGESFFSRRDAQDYLCGFLKIRINSLWTLLEDREFLEAQQKGLICPIVEQLKHCPRSVILLDDIQFANRKFLDGLRSAFDDDQELQCGTTKVSTKRGIFIATSDLDTEQHLLNESMSKKEAIDVIRKLATEKWGLNRDRASGIAPYLGNIIPFTPLTKHQYMTILALQFEEVEQFIRKFLKKLTENEKLPVEWIGHVRLAKDFAETVCREMAADLHAFGARAINNWINNYIFPELDSTSRQLAGPTSVHVKVPHLIFFKKDTILNDVQVSLIHKHNELIPLIQIAEVPGTLPDQDPQLPLQTKDDF